MIRPLREPIFWLAAASLALACGRAQPAPDREGHEPPASETRRGDDARTEPPAPGEPAVERSVLLATLDRGAGAFLQKVEVQAHYEGGAFAGWEVVNLRSHREQFEEAGIRLGDVVTAINGYELERPEYLHAVFVDLRDAPAIVVEGQRAGEPFEIEIPIVEDLD